MCLAGSPGNDQYWSAHHQTIWGLRKQPEEAMKNKRFINVYLNLSHLILSYLILSYLILSYL